MSPRHLQLYKETKAPEDLPGLGRHYCTECAKWFETDSSLVLHTKGKPHKRRLVLVSPVLSLGFSSDAPRCRLKELREGPYTHEEAAAAVNYRIDNGPGRTKSQEVEMSS